MKDATIWNVLRRSWRTMMTPRGRDRPIPIHTGSADAMLLASAMQALKSDDLPSLMQSACRHLRELSGADCTSVILIDPDRGDGACRIAAGDGCPTAVIGMQVVLPLRPDGSLLHSDSERWLADTASIDLPTYTQQDFSIGLWEPIKRNHRTLGWMTAHARDASALAPMSHPVATALADIIGSALIRDRALIKFKKEAIHARALCQELPVLWLCIDGRSGTLLDCNAAINSRLGHRPFTCIGKPAAILFEGQDDAAVKEVLCRPATTEVEVGLPFHLKHRNGSIIPCVGDGILIGEMGASSPDDVRVVWVFHERQAVQWAIQRSPGRKSGASPLDFDWTLECDRERRQKSLQVLNLLRRSLQGLRCLFSEGAIGIHESDRAAQPPIERVRLLLDQAWQASEQAAITLASPNEPITDLLSALQRLAEDVSASTSCPCILECSGPVLRVNDKVRLAAFRAARELLMQMVEEGHSGRITVEVHTTTPGIARLRLLREVQEDNQAGKPHTRLHPTQHGSLGLFGIKTMLAGVGGGLTISPGQDRTTFAEFRIPAGGTTTHHVNIRATTG